jgi:transcription elongation factor GreA
MAKIIMTKEGYEKLKAELDDIRNNKRPAVIARIKAARELGDLSENADYQDAREEQSFIEGRIKELEGQLKSAEVVSSAHGGQIGVGSTVVIKSAANEMELTIVSPTESDPSKGAVSNESPIGKALLGLKQGDTAKVNTPDGSTEYKIVSVK